MDYGVWNAPVKTDPKYSIRHPTKKERKETKSEGAKEHLVAKS